MRCVSLVALRVVVVVVAPLTPPGAQLFQLWDRVIGFDRLEILAVLAAAVFVFRSRALLNAHSEEEMQCVFGVRELGMCQQGLTRLPCVCASGMCSGSLPDCAWRLCYSTFCSRSHQRDNAGG